MPQLPQCNSHLRLIAAARPRRSLFLILQQLFVYAGFAVLANDDVVFAGGRRKLKLVRKTSADFARRTRHSINRKGKTRENPKIGVADDRVGDLG